MKKAYQLLSKMLDKDTNNIVPLIMAIAMFTAATLISLKNN